MKSVTFRSDFFRIDKWNQQRVADVMRRLVALPATRDERGFQRDGAWFRLQQVVELEAGVWAGDIMRVRQNDPAKKADPDGNVEKIPLGAEEGLAEDTAFLVAAPQRVLVMQANRWGASASVVETLVHKHDPQDPAFSVTAITKPDANAEFLNARRYTKLHFRMSPVPDPSLRDRLKIGVGDALALLSDLDGIHLDVEISRGYARGELKKSKVQRVVEALRRADCTKEIEVSLKDEHNESRVVDLISQRLNHLTSLDPDQHREVSFAKRSAALHEAMRKQRKYLEAG